MSKLEKNNFFSPGPPSRLKGINPSPINSMFSTCKVCTFQDAIPNMLTSNIIYKFVCASCSASYIDDTERHYFRRMQEHPLNIY